jgi:hypothetical protein
MSEFESSACERVQSYCPQCGSALLRQQAMPTPDPYVARCTSCEWSGWAIDWRTLDTDPHKAPAS